MTIQVIANGPSMPTVTRYPVDLLAVVNHAILHFPEADIHGCYDPEMQRLTPSGCEQFTSAILRKEAPFLWENHVSYTLPLMLEALLKRHPDAWFILTGMDMEGNGSNGFLRNDRWDRECWAIDWLFQQADGRMTWIR